MADQAQKLREIVERKQTVLHSVVPLDPEPERARTLAVTSGKGGVGKTNIVANLSIALARRGRKVMVVDADLSLANVDVLLGLHTQYNLSHVIWGEKRLREIIVEGPHGIKVVPASSGVPELAMLRDSDLAGLMDQFSDVGKGSDLILIDTAAGLTDSVLSFVMASDEVLLVTTPEPTAYVDAYQMLKTIHQADPSKPVHLVVNMAQNDREARKTLEFLSQMAGQFLGHRFRTTGWILRDPEIPRYIRDQKAFLVESPHGIGARGVQRLATSLLNSGSGSEKGREDGAAGLFRMVITFLKGGKPSDGR